MTGAQTQQVIHQRLEPGPVEAAGFLIDEQGGPYLDDDSTAEARGVR